MWEIVCLESERVPGGGQPAMWCGGTEVCPTVVIFWELWSTGDNVTLAKKDLKGLLASRINKKGNWNDISSCLSMKLLV